MIVCVDSHPVPREVFDHHVFQNPEGQRFKQRVLSVQSGYVDLDEKWRDFYNQIKDSSWPDCNTRKDWIDLPVWIREEIKNVHLIPLMYVSDDLTELHIDHPDIATADLEHQEKSCRYFCKVDRQVINSAPRSMRMIYSTPIDFAVKVMTAWNESLQDVCKKNPYYDYTLWLPMQDVGVSLQELERYKDKEFFAVWLDEAMPWAWMDEVRPVFEFCAKHKIPVYFHLAGVEDAPLHWQWDTNHPRYVKQKQLWPHDLLLSLPYQRWMANVASMITEGLLDDLPDLRIVIAEKGLYWLPEFRQKMINSGWADPLPYFQRQFWFAPEIEDPGFLEKAKILGWDRLLFSTDYTHNDNGGKNRFGDYALLQTWLKQGVISQNDYDLYTHKNYEFLKARK